MLMVSGSEARGTTPTEGEAEAATGISDLTAGMMEEEESGCWVRVSVDAPIGSLIGDCAAIYSIGGGLKIFSKQGRWKLFTFWLLLMEEEMKFTSQTREGEGFFFYFINYFRSLFCSVLIYKHLLVVEEILKTFLLIVI